MKGTGSHYFPPSRRYTTQWRSHFDNPTNKRQPTTNEDETISVAWFEAFLANHSFTCLKSCDINCAKAEVLQLECAKSANIHFSTLRCLPKTFLFEVCLANLIWESLNEMQLLTKYFPEEK